MIRTSELESVVLGLVWLDGPCTPYSIRQHFLSSPTPGWSGSAGAIYPLVRRLQERGLLRSEKDGDDGRGARHYTISKEGRRALIEWLAPPKEAAPSEFALGADYLRTRMFFLEALPASRLPRFLKEVEEQLSEQVRRMEQEWRKRKNIADRFERLAARGALILSRARARWWNEVMETLLPVPQEN